MADDIIPAADLPKTTPGAFDSAVGVNEATGQAVRFDLAALPPSATTTAQVNALGDRVSVVEAAQTAGMIGFATKSAMDADLAHPDSTLALVTNDSTAANNGTYRKSGASGTGSWVLSSDRVTQLKADVENLGGPSALSAKAGSASALPANPVGYRKVVIGSVAFAMPYFAWREPLDLFVIVGQSNAEGRGNSSSSPAVTNGAYISGSTITPTLADPVGGASTGSMWPAFANEWFAQTGRWPAFVESATGGTALIPDQAGSNWSPSGTLRGNAVTAANQAIAAIAASTTFAPANVYFVWAQGEQESETINGTTITGPLYEQALEDLAAYFKAQIPSMAQMFVIRTGSRNDRASAANWAAIRTAQENACNDSANLRMVYRGTYSFAADARAMMADSVHYNQSGLNIAGKCAAREASKSSPTAEPAAPTLLATETFMDTDYTTTASSRTVSHTTASGTKMVVVAVATGRASNNTNTTSSVTFGGVAMTKLASAAGANASPAGRSDVSIWTITEA